MAIAADLAWPPYLECRESAGGLGPRLSAATRSWSRAFFISSALTLVSWFLPANAVHSLLVSCCLDNRSCVCVVRDVQIVLESSPPAHQVLKYCLTQRSFKTRPMSLISEHFKRVFIHYLHRKSSTSIILVENVVKELIILKFIHCPWDELFLTS